MWGTEKEEKERTYGEGASIGRLQRDHLLTLLLLPPLQRTPQPTPLATYLMETSRVNCGLMGSIGDLQRAKSQDGYNNQPFDHNTTTMETRLNQYFIVVLLVIWLVRGLVLLQKVDM